MGTTTQKVTANIPKDILDEARQITGAGVTQTLIEGLRELRKRKLRSELLKLRGKIAIDLDLEKSRQ